MFSAAFSSGQAGGNGTSVRLSGSLSLRVVCQAALSSMIRAWAPGATAKLISSTCLCMASVSACGMMTAIPVLCGPDRPRRTDRHFRNADPWAGAVACPFWPTGRPDRSSARCASRPGTRPRSALPAQAYSQPLRPERGSFFKSRDRLRILCRVLRAGTDMRKAELLEHPPDLDCRQIATEALSKDTLQVHPAQANHSIPLRIRAGLHQFPQYVPLLGRQFRATAPWFDINEAVGTTFVEATDPIPQRLAIHAANPGRGRPIHPIVDRCQRQ